MDCAAASLSLSLIAANGYSERETRLSLAGSTGPQTVSESDAHPPCTLWKSG